MSTIKGSEWYKVCAVGVVNYSLSGLQWPQRIFIAGAEYFMVRQGLYVPVLKDRSAKSPVI